MALSASATGTPPTRIPIKVLYAGYPNRYPEYQEHLQQAFREWNLNVHLTDDLEDDPSHVDYIVYNPQGRLQDFAPYTNVKAVLNLQAGANAVAQNPTLSPYVPLTRMMDPGLREGMVEYVVGHVLRYHLSTDQWWDNKRTLTAAWKPRAVPPSTLARERCVGILGLGELGQACALALTNLNFQVCGWSRTKKQLEGIRCFHGDDCLETVLQESDILVVLLPDTPATRSIINQETLAKCKKGVYLINAGRGNSLVEMDLLMMLDQGHVAGATLDVFATEPLPAHHPFWTHERVLVTPHVAAKSRPATAAQVVAENIHRCETGQALLYPVDRTAGY